MAIKSVPLQDKIGLGERLRSFRESLCINAKSMAEKFGTSHTAIGNWEKGNTEPPISYLVYLVESFGGDLNWLLLGKESITPLKPSSNDFENVLLKENREFRIEIERLKTELKKGGSNILVATDALGEALAKE